MTDDSADGESGLENWSQDQFAFLTDHGFVVDRVTQHTIQWRKGDRTIELSRDWRDGQVDLRFACGTGASGQKTFGLHHTLQVLAPEAWPAHHWQAWQQSTTRKYIAELAALVNAHLGAFLGNGTELWQQAGDLARDQALADVTEEVARQARRQADAAWKTRDWPAVIDCSEELEATGVPFKESEVKRLQYARRHAGNTA
jgi:hypothetical protein